MRTALALLLMAAALSAQAPVEMKLKLAKGKSWEVKQTVQLKSECTDKDGNLLGAQSGKHEVSLTEKWTDESLGEDKAGVSQVKRVWTESKMTVLDSDLAATEVEGAQVTVARTSKGVTASPVKGALDKRTLAMLAASIDPVAVLLPSKPAKNGDTWELTEKQAAVFLEPFASSLLSFSKDEAAKGNLRSVTQWLDPGKRTLIETPALKATLEIGEDGKATIKVKGTKKLGADAATKLGAGDSSIEATLVFDTKTGQPVSLEVKATQATAASSAWVYFGRGAKEDAGLSDEWTVSRTYEAK
ncbi:MAG: hypothetical protein FD180_1983 [Planctomycetota bacterium]|nr:MAG: hypothetical protein FD180_1983 [Planctomycetota bacterium]